MENRVSITLNNEKITEIRQNITNLNNILLPLLTELADGEANQMPVLGDKSYSFTVKAREFSWNHPEFAALIDTDEFNKDLNTYTTLRSLYIPISQLAKKLHDTMTIAGSEAYISALTYYGTAKEARKRGIPNSITVCDELGKQFPGRAKNRNNNEPEQ